MLTCLCFAEQIILSAGNYVFMSCCMPFWSELFMLMLNCLCLADQLSCRLCVYVMLSALMFRVVRADVYLFVSCWPDCFSAVDYAFMSCCLPYWPWLHSDIKMFVSCWAYCFSSCWLCVNVLLSASLTLIVHSDVKLFVSCWADYSFSW